MDEFTKALLEAPDSQLSDGAKEKIQKWSNPPTRLEVSQTLDYCAHGSDASDFVMRAMSVYKDTLD